MCRIYTSGKSKHCSCSRPNNNTDYYIITRFPTPSPSGNRLDRRKYCFVAATRTTRYISIVVSKTLYNNIIIRQYITLYCNAIFVCHPRGKSFESSSRRSYRTGRHRLRRAADRSLAIWHDYRVFRGERFSTTLSTEAANE